jgi:hypothetical protein
MVKQLVKELPQVALSEQIYGDTALTTALWHRIPLDVVSLLVTADNVNIPGREGSSPLIMATGYHTRFSTGGRFMQIRGQAHTTRTTENIIAASSIADSSGDVMRLLLKSNADVNMVVTGTGNTVLHSAVCRHIPSDLILQLISYENVNVQDSHGKTPLHKVASANKNYKETIHNALMLLDHGADCNVRDFQGNTPLWLYLADTRLKHICQPLLSSLIGRTRSSEVVYLAIFACIVNNLNHHLHQYFFDAPNVMGNLKYLVQQLPVLRLKSIQID